MTGVTATSDSGRGCCHQKGGAFRPPVAFLGIEKWWSLQKFPSSCFKVQRTGLLLFCIWRYGKCQGVWEEGALGWRGRQHPKDREGRADTQYRGPMPSTAPECRRQAESLCWANEGVTCSTCQATLSTQHGYPRARPRSLMLWACDFAGNHIWVWEVGCGFSWQVNQTHYPGHSHLCPHRSQFLHSDAWLHGWGINFTKDSGILHPLKGMSCLNFVAVKPHLGWMWKECR